MQKALCLCVEGDLIDMKNVETKVDGDKLVITVDLTKNFGPSKSGKTVIIATTEGNVALEERPEVKIGLNIYKPNR